MLRERAIKVLERSNNRALEGSRVVVVLEWAETTN